jgi:signal transduction histidine kinase
MTLRRKLSLQVGGMLAGLLLVSGASLWGIEAVRQDYGVALDGYQRLRQAYAAGARLATAQKLLVWSHPLAVAAARAEVQAAVTDFEPLATQAPLATYEPSATAERPANIDPPAATGGGLDAAAAAPLAAALRVIVGNLELIERSPAGQPPPEAVAAQRDAIVAQLGQIATLAGGIRRATEAAQQAADAKRRATIWALVGLCSAVVLAAVGLGALHYRGVMTPIRRLTDGVHRLTAGQFAGRVDARGKDELAGLARDFNRMAEELDGFYHQLEQKVAAKSRELVRSERLASVGYLAAGVAHEINNPLGIISGYAEYSLAELGKDPAARGGPAGSAADDVARSLEIIRDEAFRCKGITQQLLSLARGGDDPSRRPVSLLAVANEVAAVVGGLREHRDKRLVVRAADPPARASHPPDRAGDAATASTTTVSAVEAEMKQVVLNLTVNALDAVAAGTGEVRIDVRPVADDAGRDGGDGGGGSGGGGWVELSVADNGRGMSPATLERVFEPFFTEKRGAESREADPHGSRADDRHGTGLGLSITHAIVQSHGGTIAAESGGPGTGSRFVVRLPAASAAGGTGEQAAPPTATAGGLSGRQQRV